MKTTVFTNTQLLNVEVWIKIVAPLLVLRTEVRMSAGCIQAYKKNINDRDTWRIRKLLEIGLSAIDLLDTQSEQQFARCILLKTGQWALDCRTEIPSTRAFQKQLGSNAEEMIDAAHAFATRVRRHSPLPKTLCIHRSAIGVDTDSRVNRIHPLKLILTSPPYPGLHVLYHRWQVKGRRETPAPFWIAGTLDGDGASFYTFGDRRAGRAGTIL